MARVSTDFLLNGNLDVNIGKNAVVENRGFFRFGVGVKSHFAQSTVAGSLTLENNKQTGYRWHSTCWSWWTDACS